MFYESNSSDSVGTWTRGELCSEAALTGELQVGEVAGPDEVRA